MSDFHQTRARGINPGAHHNPAAAKGQNPGIHRPEHAELAAPVETPAPAPAPAAAPELLTDEQLELAGLALDAEAQRRFDGGEAHETIQAWYDEEADKLRARRLELRRREEAALEAARVPAFRSSRLRPTPGPAVVRIPKPEKPEEDPSIDVDVDTVPDTGR